MLLDAGFCTENHCGSGIGYDLLLQRLRTGWLQIYLPRHHQRALILAVWRPCVRVDAGFCTEDHLLERACLRSKTARDQFGATRKS